ncbi:MAG: ATP-dependent Clp protease ATP-binding subunit [Patescibacteria group bacterium]|nr:ATP-dependent Clp protease ATP-binding subunit [Patescibacteria group bacterium]
MMFEKKPPLDILACPSCKATGLIGFKKCAHCHGMSMGLSRRGQWQFWSYPLTRYNLALLNGRRIFNKIRRITAVVLWLNCWVWAGLFIYQTGAYKEFLFGPSAWLPALANLSATIQILFWLGVITLCYFWYRTITEKKAQGAVEKYDYDKKSADESTAGKTYSWGEALKLPRHKKRAIDSTFTDEAMAALAEAYGFADKNNYPTLDAYHLFYALLAFNRISNVFIRLGLPAKSIRDNIFQMMAKPAKSTAQNRASMPLLSPDLQQILFQAYEEAYQAHQDYVSVTELLVAVVAQSPEIQEFLYDLEVDKRKLANAVEWARIRERLYRQYIKYSRASSHRSKKGMDKAMTALATPYLNAFSEDLTLYAQLGRLDFAVARDREMEELFRIVEGGGQNVILVGVRGVGKRSIVEGLAERMAADDVPKRLQDKRLVRLSVSALLSGTTPTGAIERLRNILSEVRRARNVILFIHNIHELIGVSAGAGSSLDVADTLAEQLSGGEALTIATTATDEYARHIAGSSLSGVFTKLDVKEMEEDQAIQAVESRIGALEYKHQVFFSYDAVEKAVQMAARFTHENCLPGSALAIVSEAAAYARNKKGADSLVSAEEIAQVVSDKTGIPTTAIGADESGKLLKLEEAMHQRVIGQDEAVDLVANALRRARVEIRSKAKPIANFLFLGPTGVGKTELAKTIAAVYFGGEEKMVRLDMSEYQDKSGIYRLIGAPGEKGTGILTEAIRQHPFTLLLLDEIEKADPDILNIFLQVMDDGRLTDSAGRVVDFTNAIIIATSNAGTSYVQEQLHAGLSTEAIKERLLHGELKQYFRPEFLNRFDGIVLFKPLALADIKKIAKLMLKRVAADLDAKGIELVIGEAALDFLAQAGYDPDFGARPMRRVLQERVENQLAEMLLSGTLKRRDKVMVGGNGELSVI